MKLLFWKRKKQPECAWMTEDGWGYGNKWYCTVHNVWYPKQVFMRPPDKCGAGVGKGAK